VLRGDASRVFIARAAPVAAGGAVLVLHDITDLRKADQIRRDFVANVSHELRTPLTAIRGYVEALSESNDPEQNARFIDIIARQSARMEGWRGSTPSRNRSTSSPARSSRCSRLWRPIWPRPSTPSASG
jgi:hypothetical protein